MKTLTVKAAPGVKVPREDNARRYITDAETLDVLATPYYLRRINDGDLVESVATVATTSAKAKGDV